MLIPKRRSARLESIAGDAASSFAFKNTRRSHIEFYWHHHPELEVALILKGQGLRFVGDSIENFSDGDLCFLGSHLPHTWQTKPLPRRAANWMVIQFLPDVLGDRFLNLPEARRLKRLFEHARRGLVIEGKTRPQVTKEMLAMRGDPPGSLRRLHRLITILFQLAECPAARPLSVAGMEPNASEGANRKIDQVFAEVSRNLQEIPSQREIAERVRLSPPAFSRFFKRSVGKTYVEYVNELRIGTACRLLLETDLNVTEAAFEAGFDTLSNFHRHFQRLKGMSPLKYRRKALH